jgi:hypothetical protein
MDSKSSVPGLACERSYMVLPARNRAYTYHRDGSPSSVNRLISAFCCAFRRFSSNSVTTDRVVTHFFNPRGRSVDPRYDVAPP